MSTKRLGRRLPAIAVAALLAGSGVAAADEIVLAHGANPGNPRSDAAEMFAELVERYSGGAITVNVAGAASLGDDSEMIQSVKVGTIQMTANSQGAFSQVVPEVATLGLPFLFNELPDAWVTLDGPVGAELSARAEKKGFVIIGWWDNGVRHITTVKGPITVPADVEGLKIRTPPDPMTLDIFKALGANPAPLAWSELPTALKTGTFEAQENPLTNIHSAKLHEITTHISLTGHKYEGTPIIANAGWWKGLSDAHRDAIGRAVAEAGWYQRGRNLIDNDRLVTVIKQEGGNFQEVDKQPFVDATASVYESWKGKFPDFVALLTKEAAAAKAQ